jgi:hypothetical protein
MATADMQGRQAMNYGSVVISSSMFAVLLSGCIVTDREAAMFYTRADVDAITAEMQCKQLARNLVQISRCETRR